MIGRIAKLLRIAIPDVHAEGLLFASGGTVPTDGTSGYQTGCLFQHIDGGANSSLYVNEGTYASSAFAVIGTMSAAQQAFLDDVTAGTVAAGKAVVVDANKDISSFRNVLAATFVETQGAPAAITDGDTAITAANLQSKILTMASSTSGRAPTVPTGTAVNAIVATGNCIDWYFLNTGNQTVTITAATGHTLVGTMEIPMLTQGHFRTRVSAANTAITYRLA